MYRACGGHARALWHTESVIGSRQSRPMRKSPGKTKTPHRLRCGVCLRCEERDYITVVVLLIIVLFIGDLPAQKRLFVERDYEPNG